jgi:hypothetical protein
MRFSARLVPEGKVAYARSGNGHGHSSGVEKKLSAALNPDAPGQYESPATNFD